MNILTAIALVLVLGICYGFYFLLTEGKPIKINRFTNKQAIKDFNQRYKEGFYNGPQN